jgi:hypothetical protein
LPYKVQEIYQEPYSAVVNRQRTLAGIGIRAMVEAVCQEEGAVGHNLEERIDDLVQKGKLAEEGAEILHGTRLLGNKAAHEVEALQSAQLDAAMRVAENLLETVYVLPSLAKHLPRRAIRTAAANS